jgi:hypothetical protein
MSQTSPKSISLCDMGTNIKCVYDDASDKCERCKKMGYSEECKKVFGPAKQSRGLEWGEKAYGEEIGFPEIGHLFGERNM